MLRNEPDRFYPERRDAPRAFTIRDAFPRQAIHDSACPLRTPTMNRRPPRDFAHRASDFRLRFTLRLTLVTFAPPRGFLWKKQGRVFRACTFARIFIRQARSPFTDFSFPLSGLTSRNQLLWTVAARRLLQTRTRRTGTLSSAITLARDRGRNFSRNYASFHVCVAFASGETRRPQRADSVLPTAFLFREATACAGEASLWNPSLARRKPKPNGPTESSRRCSF